MTYIRYVVNGEYSGVQCSDEHAQAAIAEIKTYVGFQRIVSVEKRGFYSLAAFDWYPRKQVDKRRGW